MKVRVRWWQYRWVVWGVGLLALVGGWLVLVRPSSDRLAAGVLGPGYEAWRTEQPTPTIASSAADGGVLSLGTGEKPWQDVYIQTGGGEPQLVLDYGELVLGTPVLTLDSVEGGNLNLRYTDRIDGKDYEPLSQVTGFSLTKGQQTITDSSRLFRYLTITFTNHPAATKLKDVQLKDVRQGSRLGYFHSSDAELNAIWRMSTRSIELSTAQTYIDSPHRDNATWLGDAREVAWADQLLTGDRTVVDATLAAFSKRIRPDGAMIAVDHLSPDNHEDWVFLDYLSQFALMVNDHYEHFHDRAVLDQYKDLLYQQLDYLKQRTNATGLLVVDDTLAPANDWSSTKRSGVVTYHQVRYWEGLRVGAQLARNVGDADQASEYEQRADVVKSETLRQLTDPTTGLLLDFLPQSGVEAPHIPLDANTLALLADWYEPAAAQANLKQLQNLLGTLYGWKAVDRPYSHIDGRFDISPMMNAKVVQTLLEYGQYDTDLTEQALALSKALWGTMRTAGATSVWEFLSPSDGSIAGSVSHGWSGLLARILPEQLVGLYIDQARPNHYRLTPKLSVVDDFQVAIPTQRGTLAFSSRKAGRSYELELAVPTGATAELIAPDGLPMSYSLSSTLHGGRLYKFRTGPDTQL